METITNKRQPRPGGYDRSGQMMVEFWPVQPAITTAAFYSSAGCPECGAPEVNGHTCREQYEGLLELETRDPAGAGSVHSLSVLCYVLQHPRDYSDAALNWGITSLQELLGNTGSQKEHGPKPRSLLAGWTRALFRRKPKFKAGKRPAIPSRWRVTIDQVFHADPNGHPERVQQWARSILADLES
jgi:hypothetical protein